jgi:hypothetical protein
MSATSRSPTTMTAPVRNPPTTRAAELRAPSATSAVGKPAVPTSTEPDTSALRRPPCPAMPGLTPVTHAGELHDRIRQTIAELLTGIWAHTPVVAQRLGLGDTDSRFLALLALHGSLTPSQFASITGLTTGAVTGVVHRLDPANAADGTR